MAQQNLMTILNELQQMESFIHHIHDSNVKQQATSFLSSLYQKYNELLQIDGDRPTVLVDMDEVLADLIGSWIKVYNDLYDDNLTHKDVTQWDTTLIVKKECGTKIFDLLRTPGLFRYLEVRPYAQEFIQNLVDKGVRVLVVSDSPIGDAHSDYTNNSERISNPADDKRKWMAEHFPMIPTSQIIFTSQKWFVHGDVIVDDKPATFEEFQKRGRHAVLVDQPFNQHIQTPYRAIDMVQAEQMVLKLIGK